MDCIEVQLCETVCLSPNVPQRCEMAFPWLSTLQGTAAVGVAARRGILDALARDEVVELPQMLADLLVGAGVLRRSTEAPELTPSFAAAWRREAYAIKACTDFILGAATDVAGGLENMLFNLPDFMSGSNTFRLFQYDKALGTAEADLEATRPWVSYLEALARHEAPILAPYIPLSESDRLLEVGGNTGLMASSLVSTYKGASATVFDLPAVCALGEASSWSTDLEFYPGDARRTDAFAPFADDTNVILFKSVLHDWPDDDVRDMLERAIEILPEKGRIIVCERGPFGQKDAVKGDIKTLANLVFAPFYRAPDLYREIMEAAGLSVGQSQVEIDMTFHITTGTKT